MTIHFSVIQSQITILFENLKNYLLEALEHLIAILLIYVLVCLLLYYLVFRRNGTLVKSTKLPKNCDRVLLVIAHPDDECMFFGPTLIALKKRSSRIFVLCLSKGDYDKKGHIRKDELWESCKTFGIKADDITLISSTHLKDDPTIEWRVEIISALILKHMESLDINLMITFDKDGISHHPNHTAIYYSMASICLSGLLPKRCKILILESVNVVRKYLSCFDVAISLLLSTNWSILTWRERKVVQLAMQKHKSQMVWFRKLYIVFSRYMLINTLVELNLDSVEFEILET